MVYEKQSTPNDRHPATLGPPHRRKRPRVRSVRRADESDPAFVAFAAYLDVGSLRDAYRQRSGKAQATSAPGAWTGWSTKHNWVRRRAAFVEFTIRECQEAIQVGLVQIRRRFVDVANTLLDDGSVSAIRTASRVIVEHFPPVA